MANINEQLTTIKSSVYGAEIRAAIASALEEINAAKDVTNELASLKEMLKKLSDKIETKGDEQELKKAIDDVKNSIDVVNLRDSINDVSKALTLKADQSEVNGSINAIKSDLNELKVSNAVLSEKTDQTRLSNSVAELQKDVANLTSNVSSSSDMSDAILINQHSNEISALKKSLYELSEALDRVVNNDGKTEIMDIKDTVSNMASSLSLKANEGDVNEAVNALRREVNDLKDAINEVSNRKPVMSASNISEQISMIKNSTYGAEIKDAIANALETINASKDYTGDLISLRATLKQLSAEIDAKADKKDLDKVVTDERRSQELENLKSTINNVAKVLSLKADSEDLNEELASLKKDIDELKESNAKVKTLSLASEPAMTKGVLRATTPLRATDNTDSPATQLDVTQLRAYTNEQLDGKASQHDFDWIVGNGFQGWTITDYIIRMREDLHEALASMASREEAAAIARQGVEDSANIVSVNEEAGSGTKLSFEVSNDEIELVEKSDLDQSFGLVESYFTFDLKCDWEIGGIDEHGFEEDSNLTFRNTGFLVSRDFEAQLNSLYSMQIIRYDKYKMMQSKGLWIAGSEDTIKYYDEDDPNTLYIKILIKRNDGEPVNDPFIVSSIFSATMHGTDWTGQNDNKAVDIKVVNDVKNDLTSLTGRMIGAEGRLSASESNANAMEGELEENKNELSLVKTLLNQKFDRVEYGEDFKIYFYANNEIVNVIGPVVSGTGTGGGGQGGGGGDATNNAHMEARNTSGFAATTIPTGTSLSMSIEWSSVEDELPTGDGMLTVYVNGTSRIIRGVQQGTVTFDVSKYFQAGRNVISVTVADVYENKRYINLTVYSVSLVQKSTFDTSIPFTGPINFPYAPSGGGDVELVSHFKVDGTELSTETTTLNNRQFTKVIPAQSHGAHTIESWVVADVNGEELESAHIKFEFMSIEENVTTPIITSQFFETSVEQYKNINIPYKVYTPTSFTSRVQLLVDGDLTQTITVDRTEQTWSYRSMEAGTKVFTIKSGTAEKSFTVEITESSAKIGAVEEDLALYLTAQERSNGEDNPATWTYNDISATLTGFNFVRDGWVLDDDGVNVLRLEDTARVTIPYKIFERDFKTTGKTIEIEFATRQVSDYSATVLSCFADNTGIKVTPQQITFRGAQTEISTLYKDNEHVRLSVTVSKQNNYRLILVYINGIASRAIQYASGERFSQLTPVNITIGSSDCGIDIYAIRVYDNDLTKEQIVDNCIADTQNVDDMLRMYDRNRIYNDYGEVVSSNLPTDLPFMIIEADALPDYKGDKKTFDATYVDTAHPNNSFTATGIEGDVQGTSSAIYYRKNYDLKFKTGFVIGGQAATSYALRDGSIPFNRFVLKADVASSEGANNTELTMYYNDLCPYKTPEMRENDKVRWGIEGIPIVLFWRDINNDVIHFMGKYNFNLPKRCPAPLGYSSDLESWEFERNNSANVKFQDNDFTTMAWDAVAQEYYPEWYDDWEARFPSDEWRDTSKLNEFVSWVKSTWRDEATNETFDEPAIFRLNTRATVNNYSDDLSYTVEEEKVGGVNTGYFILTFTKDTPAYRLTKFKAELGDYVVISSAVFYYIFTETFLMIDSRAKNMFIGFNGDPIENTTGRFLDRLTTFQPYDMDTALGTNNSGVLMFPPYLEDTDTVSTVISGGDSGGSDAPVFNAQDSVFWQNVRDSCRAEITAMYRSLRAGSLFNYSALEKRFEDHQAKWSEAIFNEDAWVKYITPLVEEVTYDETLKRYIKTDRYLTMLQGAKTEQRKWWLWNRFRYMDSKYVTGDASANTISIRLFNAGTLAITPAIDMYVGVSFGGGTTPQLERTSANTPVNFSYVPATGVTEMETWIYSADLITDVGDLSVFYPNECDFSRATRLKDLKIGDARISYSNANLKALDVSNSTLLETIDVRNCPALAITVNLENSPRLKEAYFEGTSITGVDFANGGALETVHLPGTITALTLINLSKLTDFTAASLSNVTRLMLANIDATVVDPITTLQQMPANSQVYIEGLEMTVSTTTEIGTFYDLLDTMRGVTRELGGNGEWMYYDYDTAQVSGVIHVPSARGDELATFASRYPYITIDAAHTSSVRTYANWDGTTIKTVNCLDGAPQDSAPSTASRASTAQYTYTFIGWSTSQDSETADFNPSSNTPADTTVYAAYRKTLQTYTITWKNQDNTTLETDTGVAYGSMPTYNGATPTYNGQTAVGWTPNVTTVTGNATYTARYRAEYTVRFYNGSTLLDTVTVLDGDNATYTGATPTNTDNTTFLGWARSSTATAADANALNNITANTDVYAIFEDPFVYEDAEISDSWDTIISNIDNGTYKTKYKVGNYKALDLGTEGTINARISGIDVDTASNGTGTVPITICFDDALNTTRRMNASNTTEGGYAATELKAWLDNGDTGFMSLVPETIRDRIVAVDKYTKNYDANDVLSSERAWLYSAREVIDGTSYEARGVDYKKFFDAAGRIKTKPGSTSATYWWLRSANSSTIFRCVGSNGLLTTRGASDSNGVVVGFCLGTYVQAHKHPTDTLDDVIAASSDGTYATKYKVGDLFDLDLGTEGNVMAQILAFDADDKADGTGKAHVSLGTYYIANFNTQMNTTNTTEGGYRDSAGRAHAQNGIKPTFPASVLSSIVPVTKTQTSYNNGTSESQTTTEDVFMLDYNELNTGGKYADVLGTNVMRKKTKPGSINEANWWLRSAHSSSYFRCVSSIGILGNQLASSSNGVVVGFCF